MVEASSPSPWRKLRKTISSKRPAYAVWVELAAVLVVAFVAVYYLGTRQNETREFTPLEIKPDSSIQLTDMSIAILPFEHRSSHEEDLFFTDGFHDELITHISKIKDIRTIARTSVMGYRGTTQRTSEIGEAPNVRYLVEGGVQRGGDEIRINVYLVEASTEAHVWAENYTLEMSAKNVFKIQNEIAHEIAGNLEILLSPAEEDRLNKLPTENLAALEAYFKGKELMDDSGSTEVVESAIEYFEKAISLDPEFALSHAHLAGCQIYLTYGTQRPMEPILEKAQVHIDRALEIDPDHAEGLFYLAWVEELKGNLQSAIDIYENVVHNNPNYVRAHARLARNEYTLTGNNEERVRSLEKALTLDPGNPDNHRHRFNLLGYKGEWKEMLRYQIQRISENPQNAYSHHLLADVYFKQFGRYDEAFIAHRKRLELDPKNNYSVAELMRCYFHLGDVEQAIAWGEAHISLWPENSISGSLRRNIQVFQDNDPQVMEIVLKYLETRPRTYWPLFWATDLDLKHGNAKQALTRLRNSYPELFDPAVELRPGNYAEAAIAAVALSENGENEHAARLATKVLELQTKMGRPFHFQIMNQAYAYHAKGDESGVLLAIQAFFNEGGSPYVLELRHFLEPYFDLPEYQAMADKRKAELAMQLERIRRMEANGELPPLPEHLANSIHLVK